MHSLRQGEIHLEFRLPPNNEEGPRLHSVFEAFPGSPKRVDEHVVNALDECGLPSTPSKNRGKKEKNPKKNSSDEQTKPLRHFSPNDLKREHPALGQGSFAVVYKGSIKGGR